MRLTQVHRGIATAFIAAGLLWGSIGRTDDAHEGEEMTPAFDGGADASEESGGSNPSSVSPSVVERAASANAQIRDAKGKLTAPPNFRAASDAFEGRIFEARNPKPAEPPVPLKKPTPELDIEEIPTYAGGSPKPATGYIGSDLSADAAARSSAAAAQVESATAEKEKRDETATIGQIRSAMVGNIQTDVLATDDSVPVQKKKPVKMPRSRRSNRAPASQVNLDPTLATSLK